MDGRVKLYAGLAIMLIVLGTQTGRGCYAAGSNLCDIGFCPPAPSSEGPTDEQSDQYNFRWKHPMADTQPEVIPDRQHTPPS